MGDFSSSSYRHSPRVSLAPPDPEDPLLWSFLDYDVTRKCNSCHLPIDSEPTPECFEPRHGRRYLSLHPAAVPEEPPSQEMPQPSGPSPEPEAPPAPSSSPPPLPPPPQTDDEILAAARSVIERWPRETLSDIMNGLLLGVNDGSADPLLLVPSSRLAEHDVHSADEAIHFLERYFQESSAGDAETVLRHILHAYNSCPHTVKPDVRGWLR